MRNIPTRLLLRTAAAGIGVLTLVALGGTAAAASGVLTAAPGAASQGASPSGSSAPSGGASPSGSASPDRDRDDHDGHGRHYHVGRDGKDGDDGSDGKDGKTRTVYVDNYVTHYLSTGGDHSRVNSGGQVAIYPSGGVDTGRA
jgi:hypothetical protein